MTVDRLDALLQRFSVSARVFHAGALCGISEIPSPEGLGQLHLVRRGPVEVHEGGRLVERLVDASLVFYPRRLPHRFHTDAAVGADMACAHVAFAGDRVHPLAQALPARTVLALADLGAGATVAELLFEEAFAQRCGRQQVVDRLFEVVIVHVLRALMQAGRVEQGLLAGLAHPRLARALVALHEAPAEPWTLPMLAARAGMSRSQFASVFPAVVGATPGDYLARYRIALAQEALRRGRPLKLVAGEVGYGSTAALSRAFRAACGRSPREWLKPAPAG